MIGIATIIGEGIGVVRDMLQGWRERKQAKLQHEIKVTEATTEAKIDRMKTRQEADIAWENTALVNAGIKDEIMMVIILAPMIMCFFPGGAEYVKKGFDAMRESLPWYWEWAFFIVLASSFGVRKFVDFMSIKKGA